jgi:hypothetical protein
MNRERIFIEHITSEVYKMLVLREKTDNGDVVYLEAYVKSLYLEVSGACYWSSFLAEDTRYASVTSILAYLSENEVDYPQYRRGVFKMLGLLNKISKELGGDA